MKNEMKSETKAAAIELIELCYALDKSVTFHADLSVNVIGGDKGVTVQMGLSELKRKCQDSLDDYRNKVVRYKEILDQED